MTFVAKPNTGSLWPNLNKPGDKHPDVKGEIVVDKDLLMALIAKGENPVKIALSGWNSTTMNGRDYVSLKASEPYVAKPRIEPEPKQDDGDDGDVPF